jgi:hypothetical protein
MRRSILGVVLGVPLSLPAAANSTDLSTLAKRGTVDENAVNPVMSKWSR